MEESSPPRRGHGYIRLEPKSTLMLSIFEHGGRSGSGQSHQIGRSPRIYMSLTKQIPRIPSYLCINSSQHSDFQILVNYRRNFVASLKGGMRGKCQVRGRKKLPHHGAEKLLEKLRRWTRGGGGGGGYSRAVRGNAGMCERATWDSLAAATVRKSTTLSL